MNEIQNELNKLIIDKIKINTKREFKEDDDLVNDLGLDSLSLVELIMEIEENFEFEVEEEEMSYIYKYGKLLKYVMSKVK